MYNEPSSMFCLFQEDLVSPISLKDEVKFVWNQTSWSEGYSYYKNGGGMNEKVVVHLKMGGINTLCKLWISFQ